MSSGQRRKRVVRRKWVEDELTIYSRVPESATFTPFTLSNPTDHAPMPNGQYEVFDVFHAGVLLPDDFLAAPLRAGEWGDGHEASAGAEWVGDASSMAAVNATAQPISGTESGHCWHSTLDFGATLGEWRQWVCRHTDFSNGIYSVETDQVASQCSWGAPNTFFQFNAFMKETTPPVILEFTAVTEDGWDGWTHWTRTRVKVWVTEVSDYTLVLFVPDSNSQQAFMGTTGTGNYHEALLSISWDDMLWKYTVNVTVEDHSGNAVSQEKQIKGVIAGIVDVIVNFFVGLLKGIATLVMKALSFLYDIIVGIVKGIINAVLTPIVNAISNWISGMKIGITEAFSELSKSNPSPEEHESNAANIFIKWLFSGSFFYTMLMLGIALQVIGTIVSIFSFGAGAALTPLLGEVIVPLIETMIFGALIEGIAGVVGVAAFAALMYYAIPEEDPFWTEGLGIGLMVLGPALYKLVFNFKEIRKLGGLGKEVVGWFLAIGGILLQVFLSGTIVGVLGGLILSTIGVLITILNKAPNDYNPFDPFRHIEELFATVAFGYSVVNSIRFGVTGE